jgi:ribonuclease HII
MKICGMDEVGRGALAGPLVACAVILNNQIPIPKLNDSKKLNKKHREEIFQEIIVSGAEIVIEEISVRLINSKGIGWANKEIFKRLIRKIDAHKYIIDGNFKINIKGKNIKSVIKADSSRKCVMAASIVAKVTRDRLMQNLHTRYPDYGWERNVGYGTRLHIEAIRKYGEVRYHRTVFVTTAINNYKI